jgi:hypothetical protein
METYAGLGEVTIRFGICILTQRGADIRAYIKYLDRYPKNTPVFVERCFCLPPPFFLFRVETMGLLFLECAVRRFFLRRLFSYLPWIFMFRWARGWGSCAEKRLPAGFNSFDLPFFSFVGKHTLVFTCCTSGDNRANACRR